MGPVFIICSINLDMTRPVFDDEQCINPKEYHIKSCRTDALHCASMGNRELGDNADVKLKHNGRSFWPERAPLATLVLSSFN